jgi:tripartite tricarboxylate transporter TctB family protein
MNGKAKAPGADLVIPVLAIAFTAYFFFSTRELQWEARANGLIIGVALIALSAAQLVRIAIAVVRRHEGLGFSTLLGPPDALPKRLGMLAVTIAFVATIPWLGLGLGLFLALAAGFWIMGVRPARHVLLVSFIITAVCWVLFTVALDIGLPPGPVESLLHHFAG